MYAKLDDPRAVVERRVARKAWQLLALGLGMVVIPVTFYVAGVCRLAPLDAIFPAGRIASAQWVLVVGIVGGGVVLTVLTTVRHLPLVRRGQATDGWVERTGWSAQHFVRVTFRYEVGGEGHRITRARPEAEVARCDDQTRITVVYDPRCPTRADVVVLLERDDLLARLATGLRLGLGEAGSTLALFVLFVVNVSVLALAWEISGAPERVKNTLIPPTIFIVLALTFVEWFWLRRRGAKRRGLEFAVSPLDKLKILGLFVGAVAWTAWGIHTL